MKCTAKKRKLFAKVAHKVDEYSCTLAATRTGKVVQTRMVTWSVKVNEKKSLGKNRPNRYNKQGLQLSVFSPSSRTLTLPNRTEIRVNQLNYFNLFHRFYQSNININFMSIHFFTSNNIFL